MTIKITSSAFADGQPIPKKHTGEGADVSPPLAWSNLPARTQELALICDDPDAPSKEPWVHWVIYKIPANLTGLPEGVAQQPQAEGPGGGVAGTELVAQGAQPRLSWADAPARPRLHHYHFKLYALDAKLAVEPGLDKTSLAPGTGRPSPGRGRACGHLPVN